MLGRLAGHDLQQRLCHLLVFLMPLSSTSCPGSVKGVLGLTRNKLNKCAINVFLDVRDL